jgi:hypothetical protein
MPGGKTGREREKEREREGDREKERERIGKGETDWQRHPQMQTETVSRREDQRGDRGGRKERWERKIARAVRSKDTQFLICLLPVLYIYLNAAPFESEDGMPAPQVNEKFIEVKTKENSCSPLPLFTSHSLLSSPFSLLPSALCSLLSSLFSLLLLSTSPLILFFQAIRSPSGSLVWDLDDLHHK